MKITEQLEGTMAETERFTADEMDKRAGDVVQLCEDGCAELGTSRNLLCGRCTDGTMLRQAASDLRERERIMAALADVLGGAEWYDLRYQTGLSEARCREIIAIRRAAGLGGTK